MSDADLPAAAADAPTPAPPRGALALLRHGPFGRYMAAEAVSMTGTWMQTMAQSWVMTGLTQSSFMLSTVNAAGSLPMLVLTMYGGTVADRYDKRKILVATQVVQILLAAGIGWLTLAGRVQIWHILTAAVLLGISSSFEMPSSAAFVPEMVEREEIPAAVGIDRSVFHGSRLLGQALAGYCVYLLGTASAFFANSLSFLPMIGVILSIRARPQGTTEEEEQRTSGGIRAGIDFVRADRPTLAMLGLMASNSFFIFPFMAVMMPLYARDILGLNAKYTGLVMAVSGVGAVVASVGMLSVPRRWRIPSMVVGSVDICVALLALANARAFWQAALAVAALGVGTSFNYGLANTTVQERAPGPLRGRVSALAMMSFVAVMPFASMFMGWMADRTSIRFMMTVGGIGYALASFFIFAGPARGCSHLPNERTAAVPVEV